MGLKDVFDKFPNIVQIHHASEEPSYDEEDIPKKATIVLGFAAKGFGFGEFTFVQDEKGQLYIDTEYTGKEFVLEMLTHWIATAIDDGERDPEKHRQYNEFRGRRCGSFCEICNPE